MLTVDRKTLIAALQDLEGVPLVSYGRPRDAFKLEIDVPYWSSGLSIAEMPHTNVPKGVMVAVGDLERFGNMNFNQLKEALSKIDIYPLGDDGDFSPKTGQSREQYMAELEKWFTDRSVIDSVLHPQTELAPAISTLGQLATDQRNELIEHCTEHLHIFRNPRTGELVPPGRQERKDIAESLFEGIISTERVIHAKTLLRLHINLWMNWLFFLIQGQHKVL